MSFGKRLGSSGRDLKSWFGDDRAEGIRAAGDLSAGEAVTDHLECERLIGEGELEAIVMR